MEETPIRAGFPFNYDQDAVSLETGIEFTEESLTDQSAREEADINTIVRRFGVTGVLPEGARPVFFADFDDVFDFQSAQNVIAEANQAFMQLPGDVRERFGHDPQRFVEFCSEQDEDGKLANVDELRKMGLAPPEKVPEPEPRPQRVEIVNPPRDRPAEPDFMNPGSGT